MWVKDQNINITEDIQRTNKYLKKFPPSFVIRELQIKIRYHYTPTRMTKIQKSKTVTVE